MNGNFTATAMLRDTMIISSVRSAAKPRLTVLKIWRSMAMTSFNTYLKFYRIWMNEEDARKAAKKMMRLQHKFYRSKDNE